MRNLIKLAIISMAIAVSSSAYSSTIWGVDNGGTNIFTVDTISGATSAIGNSGIGLTDIAFDSSGELWGISFRDLYSIDKTSGATALIGNLCVCNMNGLVFDDDGNLYGSSVAGGFFTIDTVTGAATLVGSIGTGSSGDLEFVGSTLYLAGALFPSDPTDQLLTIDIGTGRGSLIGDFGVANMFGLAYSDGTMWGLAENSVYSINLISGTATLSTNYIGQNAALGAAQYIAPNFELQEPNIAVLLLLGFFGVSLARRRMTVSNNSIH